MKELGSIIDTYRIIQQQGTQVALATVVKVIGSAYRRSGARMLIAADGQTIGSVSGGCLERDVFNQARRVLQSNRPRVVTYNSMSEDGGDFNLGCNGIVDVLIEPFPCNGKPDLLGFIAHCIECRQAGIIATVFGVEGHIRATIGNRLMLSGLLPAIHDIKEDELTEAIHDDARRVLKSSTSLVKMYVMAKGRAEVFIEVIRPPIPLVIFGAGHDAVPLVRFAKELGWHVTVVDPRPGYATRTRFPLADALIVCRPDEVPARIQVQNCMVAVVMTHNFLHDAELLMTLLPLPLRYLGLLGPKQRTQRLLCEVRARGIALDESKRDRIYGPVGLDIGADTPEEIALSVIAEIQAVLAGRLGGMLRAREGLLHEQSRPSGAVPVQENIQGVVTCGYGQ